MISAMKQKTKQLVVETTTVCIKSGGFGSKSLRWSVHQSISLSLSLFCPSITLDFSGVYEHICARLPWAECFVLLDASSHLYKRVCPSVRPSVGPSVGPSPIFSNSVYALPHTQKPPLTIIRCVLASL